MEANYTEGKTEAASLQERAGLFLSRAKEGAWLCPLSAGCEEGAGVSMLGLGHSDRTAVGTLARDRCAAACSCRPQRGTEIGTATSIRLALTLWETYSWI